MLMQPGLSRRDFYKVLSHLESQYIGESFDPIAIRRHMRRIGHRVCSDKNGIFLLEYRVVSRLKRVRARRVKQVAFM